MVMTSMIGSCRAYLKKSILINAFPKSGGNSSALALAAANCDPDYGWINGPEGTNKCYMYLKVGLQLFGWAIVDNVIHFCRWSGPGLLRLLSGGWGWFPGLELWPGKIFISVSLQKYRNAMISLLKIDQSCHQKIEQANPNCYLDCYDSYCCQVFDWLPVCR